MRNNNKEVPFGAPLPIAAQLHGTAEGESASGGATAEAQASAAAILQEWPGLRRTFTAAWLHITATRGFKPGLIAEDLPDMPPCMFRTLGL